MYSQEDDKELDLASLEKSYHEGETCDSSVFSEMRSNILIMSGQHYRKTVGGKLSRGLSQANVSKSKRIRLVKNHTQKAVNDAKDIVASMVPGMMPYPTVEGEIRHQKAAEIARQVLSFGKEINKWDDFRERSIDNFFELGEVCSKIYFNPLKGGLKSFEQKVEMTEEGPVPIFKDPSGKPTTQAGIQHMVVQEVMGELGLEAVETPGEFEAFEPYPDETKPKFHGQVVIERFPSFDLLRCKSAKDMNESPWLIYRKMIANSTLKNLINSSDSLTDEEKKEACEKIAEGKGSTFRVFNSGMGSFEETEDQTLLKEKYYRQCPKYPKGYFVIWTEYGKLFEGPIPFGEFGDIAFPIKWEGFDRFESSARGFSPIKRVRPAQLEVNRCASKITEHQLTVGDDKFILNKGSKFERGVDQPGVRTYFSTGQVQVVPGRSGEQFVNYLEHNINEIYRLLNHPDSKNPTAQAFDPKAELFKMQRQKIKFTKPASKIERYFKSVSETYLFLEQKYMTEERFLLVQGSTDAVNFEEFQNIDRTDYIIKLEEVSGDLETMMGKTLELETILQYAGKDVDEQTKMSLLMQFPILSRENTFKHQMIHFKNIESDILALERGQYVPARKRDNHELAIQLLTNRMASKDFGTLDPQVQEMFEKRMQEHEQVLARLQEEIRQAQAGMIPTGGALVRADVYHNDDPSDPTKTSRLQLPGESLEWLKEQLDKQGLAQERLMEIADMDTAARVMGAGMPQQMAEPQAAPMPPMMPPEMMNPNL